MSNVSCAITAGVIMIIVFLSVCTHSEVASTRTPILVPITVPEPPIVLPPGIDIDLETDPPEPYGLIE